MEPISLEQLQQQVKDLEKQNRLLQKKLDRSQSNRKQLENFYDIQSRLFNQTIQGLEKSRSEVEERNQALQQALKDLQMMQTKLVESEKMSALGILVAGLAHEINNPINFIYVNLSYARDYVKSLIDALHLYQETYPYPTCEIADLIQELDLEFVMEDAFHLLKSMEVGSSRIRHIVSGLRNFSRLDEADYKKADIHDGLDSTLMLLQHRLNASPARPAINVVKQYSQLPKILCFPGSLNQVFMNILSNAIDAIEDLHSQDDACQNRCDRIGCITISTSIIDRWIKISIADSGLGMSDEIRQNIFNPFYTTKPVGTGTGLGLSISYQVVVEKHGGKLDCFSQLNEGTVFVIQIPIQEEKAIAS